MGSGGTYVRRMNYINKTVVQGEVVRAPELKRSQNGKSYCKVTVLTKDKPTGGQEYKTFHNITCFGDTAESAARDLKQGQLARFDARLTYSKYEKEGQTIYKTDLIAQEFTSFTDTGSFTNSKRIAEEDLPF